jgi:NADPH:quinone reductase-like Zn-dependent oxidoreductase
MRTVTQHATGGPEVLVVTEVAPPLPGPGEVRVRVGAAGVNPVDAAVRAGAFPLLGEPPFTVGWDVAGTVDAVGPGVVDLAVGDRVFGVPRFPAAASAYAEQVVAPAGELARTPDGLGDVEAAALPLAGLTAHQALVGIGRVAAGQRVLVPAAGGGVGHLAVQIAAAHGAHVVATASPGKIDLVRSLGAHEVLDRTAAGVLTGLAPVDLALDPFGGAGTPAVLEVVRPGGTVVALLDPDPAAAAAADARGVRLHRLLVAPDRAGLQALAALVDAGRLRPHVSAVLPLEEAGAAHRVFDTGATGKVVLVP